ncbi:MAG: kelch repeat-containing protein [bacterium]|nr:kelch repeat-containing protein [bacterium]
MNHSTKRFIILASIAFALLILPYATLLAQSGGTWTALSNDGYTHRRFNTISGVDGKLYVIGGWKEGDSKNLPQHVDMYDPATDTWSDPHPSGAFIGRWGHTSVVLDGKIYIFGGLNGNQPLVALQVYDPVANSWSTPVTTGNPSPRHFLASTTSGGKIYFFGGFYSRSEVNVFDPATNTFDALQSAEGSFWPTSRAGAFELGGKLYVIGGNAIVGGVDVGVDTIQVLDPATRNWTSANPTGEIGLYDAMAALDGKVYIMNGSSAASYALTTRVFDPVTNSITDLKAAPFIGEYVSGAAVTGGKLYLMGSTPSGSALEYTLQVFEPGATGVNTNEAEDALVLSPNPTSGIVALHNIPVNTTRVQVLNMLGQVVREVATPVFSELTLDLSNLPVGMYYARFAAANSVVMRTIIRQ